jgi:RNA polymerase sigma-70 factor (ECF subfamily)
MRLAPSSVIELNYAAALSMVDGAAAALVLVDALTARGRLAGYDVLPAVRADLLRRLGRNHEARAAYTEALALARHPSDRRFFQRRIGELAAAD